jgi:hypothetical protein
VIKKSRTDRHLDLIVSALAGEQGVHPKRKHLIDPKRHQVREIRPAIQSR